MTEDYVEYNNMKFLSTDYNNRLATTSIPKFFNEDLQSNSALKLNASTLESCLGKVILVLRKKL